MIKNIKDETFLKIDEKFALLKYFSHSSTKHALINNNLRMMMQSKYKKKNYQIILFLKLLCCQSKTDTLPKRPSTSTFKFYFYL